MGVQPRAHVHDSRAVDELASDDGCISVRSDCALSLFPASSQPDPESSPQKLVHKPEEFFIGSEDESSLSAEKNYLADLQELFSPGNASMAPITYDHDDIRVPEFDDVSAV